MAPKGQGRRSAIAGQPAKYGVERRARRFTNSSDRDAGQGAPADWRDRADREIARRLGHTIAVIVGSDREPPRLFELFQRGAVTVVRIVPTAGLDDFLNDATVGEALAAGAAVFAVFESRADARAFGLATAEPGGRA